jgi:hypothetical protein
VKVLEACAWLHNYCINKDLADIELFSSGEESSQEALDCSICGRAGSARVSPGLGMPNNQSMTFELKHRAEPAAAGRIFWTPVGRTRL